MTINVGRDPEWASHELRITEPTVSRKHCTLTDNGDGTWQLENLSRNGTYVGGQSVTSARVTPQTMVMLGPHYSLRIGDVLPPQECTVVASAPVNTPKQQPQSVVEPQYVAEPQPRIEPRPQSSVNVGNGGTKELPSLSMGDALGSVFSNYATFSGRARRSEYWWFGFAQGVVLAVLYYCMLSATSYDTYQLCSTLSTIISLALFLPSVAVTVRRLHDTGKSGWYILLALIPLIGAIIVLAMTLMDSDRNENEYGPSPKYQ